MDRDKRIVELEKRVAALEGKVQEQPKVIGYSIEEHNSQPDGKVGTIERLIAYENEILALKNWFNDNPEI